MYLSVSNGLGAAPGRGGRRFARVPLPIVLRSSSGKVLVFPPRSRGMGDMPGCGPSSLSEAMGSFVQDAIDFPGQTPDPMGQAISLAQMLCSEGGAGSVFGCPPMAGCDPASIQQLAQSLAAQLKGNQTYTQFQQSGSADPNYNPPIAAGSPYAQSMASEGSTLLAGGRGSSTAAASVSLQNSSRPGQPFQVGDGWQLVVSGAPNSPVSGSSTQNGASMGTTAYGSTDQNGTLVLTGVFGPSQSGAWREMWTVGSSPAPVLAFTVSAGQAAPSPAAPAPAPDGAPAPPTGAPAGAGVSSSLSSFFSQTFNLAGLTIPVWAAGATVLGGMWLMGGSRR